MCENGPGFMALCPLFLSLNIIEKKEKKEKSRKTL
jgi:hypothetical protein